MEYKLIIPSRSRWDTITTHRLVPSATVLVPESEKAQYESVGITPDTIPDDIIGLGKIRNWILDHYKEHVVVMLDDDIKYLYYMSAEHGHPNDEPDVIGRVLENTIQCALDLGVGVFGFSQAPDVRKYQPTQPFNLSGWVGGVIGVVGRDIRFTEINKFKVDVDYCLENLLQKRILWIDNRYSFQQVRERNKGGQSLFRTSDIIEQEMTFLKRKWGGYVQIKKSKTTILTTVRVRR